MSKGRLILRIVLVVLLIGVCGLGVLVWMKSGPGYDWTRAQTAIENEDWETAKIYLLKLLAKEPTHTEGHRSLAHVYREESAAAGRSSSYAANPAALNHLAEAAKLSPDDLEIQTDLMTAYLQSGRFKEAGPVANRVLEADPENVDALFAAAWVAIDRKENPKAKELLDRLLTKKSLRPFQTLALLGTYNQNIDDEKALEDVLTRAVDTAKQTDAEMLASLSRREHDVMFDLFLLSLARAPDTATAHSRLKSIIEVLERQIDEEAADLELLSRRAAEAFQTVNSRFPLDPKSDALRSERESLVRQTVPLWDKAVAAGTAAPIVYQLSAEAAFQRGDVERGLSLIDKGLLAAAESKEPGHALNLHLLAARRLVVLRRFNDAESHVTALIANEKSAGWGHLIAGTAASQRGEMEYALNHFQAAQRKLGNTILVQMALAKVYVSLQRWDEALPMLTRLHESMSILDAEQRAWASQQIGTIDDLQFAIFRTRIGLDQWSEAQKVFSTLVGTPQEAKARLMATLHLIEKGAGQQAEAFLAESRKKFPEDRNLALLQARLISRGTQPDEALRVMEQFAEENPKDFAVRAQMCNLLISQGKHDQALELLDKFDADEYHTDQQRLVLVGLRCKVYLAKSEPEKVLELAEKLQTTGDSERAALVLTAAAQLFNRDLGAASETLDAIATDEQAATPKLQLLRGAVAAAQGDFDESLELSARAIDVTAIRDQAVGLVLRAVERIAVERSPAEALGKIKQLVEKHPHASLLKIAEVKLLIQLGRTDEALTNLDSLIAEDKSNVAYGQLRSEALALQGKFEAALTEAARCVEIDPKNSLLFAAGIALRAGNGEQALDYCRRALTDNPDLRIAYLLQADALMLSDRAAAAGEVLTSLVKSHADWDQARIALVNYYDRVNEPAQGLDAARAAKEQFPDDFRFIAAEISMLARLDKIAGAEELAEQRFAKSNNAGEALAFSRLFLARGLTDTALDWTAKVIASDDENLAPAAHLIAGNIQLQRALKSNEKVDLERARDHFAAVLVSQPRHLVAGNNLAWLLAEKLNQPAEAVRICEQVRGEVPVEKLPLSFVDTMAMAYRMADNLSQAESLAVTVLNTHPNSPLLHFQLGLTLKESGRAQEARQSLQKAIDLGLTEPNAAQARELIAALGS